MRMMRALHQLQRMYMMRLRPLLLIPVLQTMQQLVLLLLLLLLPPSLQMLLLLRLTPWCPSSSAPRPSLCSLG